MAPETQPKPLVLNGRSLHFVGIGGCGMSGLARISRALGAAVSGSDMTETDVTRALIEQGIDVSHEQTTDTLPDGCDMLVVSAAIKADHPELLAAQGRGIDVMKYAELLGRLMLGRTGVAIAGTHGKSTTTAMLAHVLIRCGLDPTFIVGATCAQIGGGSRIGRPDVLIAEACEYDRSFHNFHPTHAVVLNVEEDHLDIYGSLDKVVEAFNGFARLAAPDGSLLIGHDGAYRTNVAAGAACPVETIGYAPDADWSLTVKPRPERSEGRGPRGPRGSVVTIAHHGEALCEFQPQLPGEHMAYNAAVAAVTARRMGAPWAKVGEALTSFQGLDRRMQTLGQRQGVTVIDDYGHHPTEIDTTLRALRQHHRPQDHGGRLICVFQPHQHSRTRFLLEQFATSFSAADLVIVPHIYFVRDSEEDKRAVSAEDLVNKLTRRGVQALHIDAFDGITAWLSAHTHAGDLVVVMGAGPVWQVAHDFLA